MDEKNYLKLINRSLQDLPEYVFAYSQQPNLSISTLYQYLAEIKRFFTWLREGSSDFNGSPISTAKTNKDIELTTLEHLKVAEVQAYLNSLRYRTNKQSTQDSVKTINRTINALRSLFKYLTVTADLNDGEPYFYRNVMDKVSALKGGKETISYRNAKFGPLLYTGQKKHDWLDFIDNEYEYTLNNHSLPFFKANKERDLAIIALLLGSGIRVSELTKLNVKDIDLANRSVLVLRKGGNRDAPLIADWAIPYIANYMQIRKKRYEPESSQKALFLTRYGKARRITSTAVENLVSKYSAAFPEGERTTPHKLRHSLGTELYDKSKDVMIVAAQLGHTGISATDQYIQQTKADKQREVLNENEESKKNS